ncbi:MAG: hypothetical protein LBT37_06545 [Lactobacillaceae bacterium]|jgi:hypothetical protein|nr:hypothetical protein [Lactobacillaceae bacterium]
MAEYSFPQRDVNGDRLYSDTDFARFYQTLFKNGVVTTVGQGLEVQANSTPNMTVTVTDGAMIINGRQYLNTSDLVLSVPVASATQQRNDSVVVRLDLNNRTINTVYKANDTSVLRSGSVYEMQLATIKVDKNISNITPGIITDKRGDSTVGGFSTPYVNVPTDGIIAQYTALLENFFKGSKDNFSEWFDQVKGLLSSDSAGNLLNKIDALGTTNISLNGDVTGISTLQAGGNISTALVDVPRKDTGTTIVLNDYGNQVDYIDDIKTDSKGRVTAVNTKAFVTAPNSTVSNWQANHVYKAGSMVYIGELGSDTTGHIKGGIFRANATHTSGSTFPANGANWTLLNADSYTRYYPSIQVGFSKTVAMYRQGRSVTAAGYIDAGVFPTNANTLLWNNLGEVIPTNLRPVITVVLSATANWGESYLGFKVGPDGSLKYKKQGGPYGDITGNWIVKPELGYEFSAGVPSF